MNRRMYLVIGIILTLSVFMCGAKISKVQAITSEGTNASDAGGVPVYTAFFSDQSGVLIVAPSRANDTGVLTVDITVVAVCSDNRSFRLQVWDSDMKTFINPNNELGVKQKQRRFTFTPLRDAEYTIFQARVTNEDATISYASIELLFYFNPNADVYKPINSTSGYIALEEHQKELRKQRTIDAVSYTTMGVIGAVLAFIIIRRRF